MRNPFEELAIPADTATLRRIRGVFTSKVRPSVNCTGFSRVASWRIRQY